MKEICFIIPPQLPYPPVRGGAVETLLDLFIKMNEINKKYSITVFSVYDEKAEKESKKLKYTNVKYIAFSENDKTKYLLCNKIQKILNCRLSFLDTYASKICKHFHAGYDPEICIIEGGGYREYIKISKFIGKNKMVIHCHGVSTPKYNSNKIYGTHIFVSTCASEFWQKKIKCNSYILKNAVDENKFQEDMTDERRLLMRKQLNYSDEDFVVLFCGRLVEIKGVLELIQAINEIEDKHIKLLIVGSSNFEGAEITDYQKKLKEHISEKIQFTGYIENNKLPDIYKLSDIVVSPSICNEAASLVNIEAMMSGCGLITTNVGGNPEYVNREGNSLIEYEGDKRKLIEALKDKIIEYYHNQKGLCDIKKSNVSYAKRFYKEKYYDNYSKIIDEIIGN